MVRVGDGARDLFRDFAEAHGVTVAALLEAIAVRLPMDGRELNESQAAVVEAARVIDADRRRRD